MSDRHARIEGYLANLHPKKRRVWRQALGLPPVRRGRPPSKPSAPPRQPRQVRNAQRDLELAVLYRGGCTLQEIGDAIGISRERVRQLIRRSGLTAEPTIGWKHESLTAPSYRLLRESGISSERVARDRHQRLRWRERVAVWVLRDLATELGRTPTLDEWAKLIHGRCPRGQGGSRLWNWLTTSSVKNREPWASISDRLYASAGLGGARALGSPGHLRHPRRSDTCRRGHPRTPENTARHPNPKYRDGVQITCVPCRRMANHARYVRQCAERRAAIVRAGFE